MSKESKEARGARVGPRLSSARRLQEIISDSSSQHRALRKIIAELSARECGGEDPAAPAALEARALARVAYALARRRARMHSSDADVDLSEDWIAARVQEAVCDRLGLRMATPLAMRANAR